MARVERFTSTEQVPVEQAQLVDPSAFQFSTAGARTLGQIGGIIEELGRRKQAADDSLAITGMRNSQKLAEAEIKQMMLDKPNPDIWEEEIGKILQRQNSQVIQLKSSKEARDKIEQLQEAFVEQTVMNGSILETTATINEDVKVTGAGLITAMGSDDELVTAEARDSHEAALLRKYAPDIAAIQLLDTLGEGEKQRISVLTNQGRFEEAKELAQKTESLTPTERSAQLNIIRAAQKRAETSRKLLQEQKDDKISEEFLGLLINKLDPTKSQLTFDMIETSDLSVDAKEKWFTNLRVFDNYSEDELKEAFTDKGEVIADIYDKIDAGTLTDELDTMVGKGLSPVTAERIKKEVRVPYERDTEQLFKRLFGWSPELGFENEFSAFSYEAALREWKEEIKRQDATGEKIREIGLSIVRPYFLEHLKAVMPSDTDISRMMELALGKEVKEPKTLKIPKPKEGEGPETYADFEAEVIRLGKVDKIKAEAFYDAWIGKFE